MCAASRSAPFTWRSSLERWSSRRPAGWSRTDGFQVSAEGIAFSLVGSDDLNQVAGQTADITGALNGTEVTLTSLITSDGQVVATSGSVEDTADWSDLVSPDTPSNNDALLDD